MTGTVSLNSLEFQALSGTATVTRVAYHQVHCPSLETQKKIHSSDQKHLVIYLPTFLAESVRRLTYENLEAYDETTGGQGVSPQSYDKLLELVRSFIFTYLLIYIPIPLHRYPHVINDAPGLPTITC